DQQQPARTQHAPNLREQRCMRLDVLEELDRDRDVEARVGVRQTAAVDAATLAPLGRARIRVEVARCDPPPAVGKLPRQRAGPGADIERIRPALGRRMAREELEDLVVRAARRHLAQRALEPRTALGLVPCGRRRASGLFRARRTHTASISSRIRARVRSSGSSPNAARAFSSMWRGLVVSVSTHVTSGFARMYFSENWAQLSQPISVAHPGSGRPSRRRKYTPFMNGRLMSAAIPRSARSGRILSSARRSLTE